MAVSLAACGGSSSSTPGAPVAQTPATNGFTGVAVDPYIVGAVFIEVDENGNTVQQSTPSTDAGRFTFTNKLTTNNIIAMLTKGLHNGVPFIGNIKRKVTSAEDAYVVSPITTLMAEGQTAAQVVTMLKAAGFTDITEASLTQDPVAAVAADPKAVMLLANLAVNTALNATGGDAASSDILTHVTEVKRVLDHDADDNGISDLFDAAGSNVAALIKTAATITNYINTEIEKNIAAGSGTAVQVLTPEQIQVVADAPVDAPVEIVVDAGGAIQVTQMTVAEHLAAAHAAWAQVETCNTSTGVCGTDINKLLETADNFIKAKALVTIDSGATAEDKDRALFFGSLAELVKLADPYTKVTNSLNTFGDMLSAFGLAPASAEPPIVNFGDIQIETCVITSWYPYQDCTLNTLNPNSPDSTKVLAAIHTNLTTRLQGVIDGMNAVSTTYDYDLLLPGDMVATNIDQTDALFLEAIAEAMIAQLDMIGAYQTDINLVDEQSVSMSTASVGLPQAFWDRNPNAGKLSADSAALLAEAKIRYTSAADSLTTAIDAYVLEKGDYAQAQSNEFISLDAEICGWNQTYFQACAYDAAKTQAEVANIQAAITKFKNGLNNRIIIDTPTNVTADLSQIFNGIDLRSKLPTISTVGIDNTIGLFPDPTIGGIILSSEIDLNEDLDGDGSPDLIDGYSYFFFDFFAGTSMSNYLNTNNSWGTQTLAFSSTNTTIDMNMSLTSYDPTTSQSVTRTEAATGSYVLDKNVMTITWDSALFDTTTTTTLTLTEKISADDCSFYASIQNKDATGIPVGQISYSWINTNNCYGSASSSGI